MEFVCICCNKSINPDKCSICKNKAIRWLTHLHLYENEKMMHCFTVCNKHLYIVCDKCISCSKQEFITYLLTDQIISS